MIDWKQRFLRSEWGIGYIVILLTTMTAYFAIKPSYIDPYYDEELLAKYVYMSNALQEISIDQEWYVFLGAKFGPIRIPEPQWDRVYPLIRAHYLSSTEAIVELLEKEKNQELEPTEVNWLREFRELNHFPEQSEILVPRYFSFTHYFMWVAGMLFGASFLFRGSLLVIKWITHGLKN